MIMNLHFAYKLSEEHSVYRPWRRCSRVRHQSTAFVSAYWKFPVAHIHVAVTDRSYVVTNQRKLLQVHIKRLIRRLLDLVGVGDNRVLVHGPAWPARAVHRLVDGRSSPRVLDDWVLQPARFPHRDAPGDHKSSQRLGSGRRCTGQWRDEVDEGGHHFAAQWR